MRIDGLLHGLGNLVDAIADGRHVAPQLLEERDDLGRLLLGQEVDLEVELRPLFGVLGLPVLRDEDDGPHEERSEPDEALQPDEGRRIERPRTQMRLRAG